MAKTNILLIWPAVRDAELYNFLPLGLGYLGANLKEDYQVKLWDGVLGLLPNSKILDEIDLFKPDLIGISVWSFNQNAAKEIVNDIKEKYPALAIVAGGPAVSGYREKIFDIIKIDYAFAGEGEKVFRHFLELFTCNGLTYENKKKINGLIYKGENGDIVCNTPRWDSIDELKYCDYALINLNQYIANGYYYGMHSNSKRTAPVLTTRGCPFPCEFCSAHLINGRKVRTRRVESVIAEIKELYEKYNIDGFNIIDDNFTFNIEYAKQICREILNLGLKNVSFNSPNGVKVEYLDEELLNLMKQVGWEYIFIAPESGSEQTLKNMQKKVKLPVVKEKIRLIKNAGLKVFGFFIIGYPDETRMDIKETINFACQNDFDSVVFTCFQPLVGTPVYEKLLAKNELERPLEGINYFKVSYAPKGLTISQIKLLRFWALFRFYTSSFKRFANILSNFSFKRILIYIYKFMK